MDSRFGGLACGIIQNLRDDFGDKAVFSFPLLPSLASEHVDLKRSTRIQANVALTLSSLQSTSSLVMPLSLSRGWLDNNPKTRLEKLSVRLNILSVHLETN